MVPLTAKLEFDRAQQEYALGKQNRLEGVYKELDEIGVRYERREPTELYPVPDLMAFLKSFGPEVALIEPTNDDLAEAHRRACLHASPHPVGGDASEMRDLVIWMIALRMASQARGGILVSHDRLFANGTGEAAGENLQMAKGVYAAISLLPTKAPPHLGASGELAYKQLDGAWDVLNSAGLAIDPLSISKVEGETFSRQVNGLAASFVIHAKTAYGKPVRAKVEVHPKEGGARELSVTNVLLDGSPTRDYVVSTTAAGGGQNQTAEQLRALRAVLGS